MRIAWVSYDFFEYCVTQVNALAADHDVFLVLADEHQGKVRACIDPRVEFLCFEKPRLRQPLRQYLSIRGITRRIKKFNPDVIHYQHGHLWFNLALPLLRRYPLVITIHDPRHHEGDGDSRKTPQAVMDFGFRRGDEVIVHGKNPARIVHEKIGISNDKIHVIPHVAIGETDIRSTEVEDDKSVLFFGRIWEYKGLEYLIKAEPFISDKIENVSITIAGRGENFGRYRQMMQNSDRFIIYDSWVGNEKRAELFQRAAVVVLPYISATQSGVVPVAYTFGKPVVATRVGSLPEYVDHGQTGLLVPPRDERALAEAIVSLLRDKKLRQTMGANARRKLSEEMAPDVVVRGTVEVYKLAIRNRLQQTMGGIR